MPIDMAKYMADRREKRRSALLDLAGNKCCRCGSIENLEFNHKDRSTKLFVLSGKGLDTAWEKILAEFEKCELLCQSCHRDYTRQQFKNKEIAIWNSNRHLPYHHGTMRMYQEKDCRCELCRKAKKYYRAKMVRYSDIVE